MITILFLFIVYANLPKRLTLTSVLAGRNWQCWRRQFSTMFL